MDHIVTPQQQQMIDRQKAPRHHGTLVNFDYQAQAANPLCGDQLAIQVKLQEGHITHIAWQGQGCIISQIGADLSIDTLLGKTLADIQAMTEDDFIALLPIQIRPSRRKCALLLQQCLQQQ